MSYSRRWREAIGNTATWFLEMEDEEEAEAEGVQAFHLNRR
jgi:hypothetical protein